MSRMICLCSASMVLLSCGQPAAPPALAQIVPATAISADCKASASSLPKGTKRVYIGLRNSKDGTGSSADDARDGSSAARFDAILRCYSEGCPDAGHPQKSVARTENLMLCLGPGAFQTEGNYDFLAYVPHATHRGFTVGKGWKLHGHGPDKTTLQLIAYLPITDAANPRSLPVGTGWNTVVSTNSDDASGVEISDLTIDGNYPSLKKVAGKAGIKALNLEAIHLRSSLGGHWIHNVKVINVAGEIGGLDPRFETFPVWIVSVQKAPPSTNRGNVIEHVAMSQFGGGRCTAIAVANGEGEVRYNTVNGYQIAYGGWSMGAVNFHDNSAIDSDYGFNIDSLVNDGVTIASNQIKAREYGMVIGGGGTYTNFKISQNTLHISGRGTGLLLQGNVTRSVIDRNSFVADGSGGVAIRNFSNGPSAGANSNNSYQANQISSRLSIVFQAPSKISQNCAFGNQDEHGKPRADLRDNHNGPCVTDAARAAMPDRVSTQ